MLQIEGMDHLVREIGQVQKKLIRKEEKALKAGAEPLRAAMKGHVKRSGKHQKHIQEDIQISHVKEKSGAKWIEVGPGKKTNWRAKFLEFGTSKMSPRPFMEPAQRESRSEVLRKIEEVMKEGVRR